jgi:LysR family glycine cleavage system transcriptional activator
MMRMAVRKLAHLNALRAFEAVARHMSFLEASRELAVTPGAISQQIRLLEDYYGVPLFRRHHRRISLTDEAAAILPTLGAGFDLLARALTQLQSEVAGGLLVVTAPPTFAVKWLAPRLGAFALAFPRIQVRLESGQRLVDLRREEVDVAIRYGKGHWPGLAAELLFDEEMVPACAPAFATGVREPADLVGARLIHDRTMRDSDPDYPDWRDWFAALGVDSGRAQGALHFSSSLAAIQAAVDGHGVILGRSGAIDEEIKEGRLVVPFDRPIRSGYSYFLTSVGGLADAPKVATFRDWLKAEIGNWRAQSTAI